MYKAIDLITKEFDRRHVHYQLGQEEIEGHMIEFIEAGFRVDCGPNLIVRFLSQDNDNDVSICILGMIHVSEDKMTKVLQACNKVNQEYRYLKFYVNTFGIVNVEYDIPVSVVDECLGTVAFEMFIRIMKDMDKAYQTFMKILYTEDMKEKELMEYIDTLIKIKEELEKKKEADMEEGSEIKDDIYREFPGWDEYMTSRLSEDN